MKFQMPFGPKKSNRSSMAGAEAIAEPSRMFEPQPQQGIGSLPSPPKTLYGGTGEIIKNGRRIADLFVNQKQLHGLYSPPPADTIDRVRQNVQHGARLADQLGDRFDNPIPYRDPSGMMRVPLENPIPMDRTGVNIPAMAADRARAQGMDVTSEAYANLILGKEGLMPQSAPQALPEEMTARALSLGDPLAGLVGPQDIQFFQPPPPEMDNSFMPVSNDGGMDGGLENPFGAPEDVQRPSLSREDIAGGIMPMAPGGYLGQGEGYDTLKQMFNDGVANKYNRDDIRERQWSQDERDQNFGGWMMGLNNIASGFAGKSRGGRRFLDAQNQGYAQQAQNSRRMRGTEMGQQFNEDKYYGDLLNENDPNSIANQAKMMNAQTGIRNAEVAMRNAQSNEELRAARAEYLKQLDELKGAEEQGRNERAALKAELDNMRIENQGRDISSKIQDRSVRAAETSRHNKASESNIQSGQGVQMRGQDLNRQNTQDNIKSREKIAGIVDKRKSIDQKIAASKQGKDGPAVSAAGRAAAGIKLDPKVPEHRQKMIEYLARAGGDKRKALELAQADGW